MSGWSPCQVSSGSMIHLKINYKFKQNFTKILERDVNGVNFHCRI